MSIALAYYAYESKNIAPSFKENRKTRQQNVLDSEYPSTSAQSEGSTHKRLRSSIGIIHDKHLCVWCRKGDDTKHNNQLFLLSYDNAWAAFKRHTVIIDDQDTRDRIHCLIENVGENPYAIEMRYHKVCWLNHVRKYQNLTDDDKIPLLQNATFREAVTGFIDHVRAVIFQEHELRSLQSLLSDYRLILSKYGFATDGVKSSYIKDVLIKEFQDAIGFHPRPQRNLSELVYDTTTGVDM